MTGGAGETGGPIIASTTPSLTELRPPDSGSETTQVLFDRDGARAPTGRLPTSAGHETRSWFDVQGPGIQNRPAPTLALPVLPCTGSAEERSPERNLRPAVFTDTQVADGRIRKREGNGAEASPTTIISATISRLRRRSSGRYGFARHAWPWTSLGNRPGWNNRAGAGGGWNGRARHHPCGPVPGRSQRWPGSWLLPAASMATSPTTQHAVTRVCPREGRHQYCDSELAIGMMRRAERGHWRPVMAGAGPPSTSGWRRLADGSGVLDGKSWVAGLRPPRRVCVRVANSRTQVRR